MIVVGCIHKTSEICLKMVKYNKIIIRVRQVMLLSQSVMSQVRTPTCKAKIKNKFVCPYSTDPVKIGKLKFFYWKFAVTFLYFFLSFHLKFILLKIPYFRFASPKDQYFRITEHIFVIKKKGLPTYPLPKLWVG